MPDAHVIPCPACGEPVTVAAEDLGHSLRCPLCAVRFPAPPPPDDPPWRPAHGPPPRRGGSSDRRRDQYDDYNDRTRREREWPYREHGESPQELVRNAKTQCTAAGTGLIVVGVLTLVMALPHTAGAIILMCEDPPDPGLALMLAYGLYSLLVGGFWVYAGRQLQQAKHYGLCLVACGTILIPGVSPCCLLGLVFGIMGLVKLNAPDVKAGFAANRPGYDPDAG